MLGSLFSHLTHLDPGVIAPVTAILTLLVGLVAAFGTDRTAFRGVLAIVLLGTVVELVGVRTGFPFGTYAYTSRWWPVIYLPGFGWFPLLVPLAWALIAGASSLVAARLVSSPAPRVLLGGLLAAVLDLVMEPVMTGTLGYWVWQGKGPLPGGAPVANFFGWFGTSVLAGLVLTATGQPSRRPNDPLAVLLGHLGLVVGLGLIG
ncbi:hypothetical protein OP10G_1624 [Fimbriimonas ginsengisoli Gsoil 348]|uniref:Carotenoid biosynthesis protein n=1 Tax=Fimbriimonas ginsengisoli Gsoil 348 TaxID=661478 RepID=A0A068NNL5_FIMGI|nr:hypothetical protein OP10G_1624 [Fimbriimonas ginsengisoli Gsoil 348]